MTLMSMRLDPKRKPKCDSSNRSPSAGTGVVMNKTSWEMWPGSSCHVWSTSSSWELHADNKCQNQVNHWQPWERRPPPTDSDQSQACLDRGWGLSGSRKRIRVISWAVQLIMCNQEVSQQSHIKKKKKNTRLSTRVHCQRSFMPSRSVNLLQQLVWEDFHPPSPTPAPQNPYEIFKL
jgi:hypothetical protein